MTRRTRLDQGADSFSRIAAHLLSPDDHMLLVEAMKAEGLAVISTGYLQHLQDSREALHEIGENAHAANLEGTLLRVNDILNAIVNHTHEMYWEPRNANQGDEGTVQSEGEPDSLPKQE